MKNSVSWLLSCLAVIVFSSCNHLGVQEIDIFVAPTLYTAPKTARVSTQQLIQPCTENCLQYRVNATDSWLYLYQDQIQGFKFEAGYNYKLRVRVGSGTNPDFGPTYTLVQTTEKIKAQ